MADLLQCGWFKTTPTFCSHQSAAVHKVKEVKTAGFREGITTLQYIMNAKLSQHRFWHCHENGLIKTIQTIPHNLYVSFKLASLYCGLRLILVYPNP